VPPDCTTVRGKCNFTHNCQELHSDIIRISCCISWKCNQMWVLRFSLWWISFLVLCVLYYEVGTIFLEEHAFKMLLLMNQRTLAYYKSARCIWAVSGNAQSFLSESSVTYLCVRNVLTVLIISVQHECDCSSTVLLPFILTVWCICTWNLFP
jgi:hypothetical protein